jgi:hypothetical protein
MYMGLSFASKAGLSSSLEQKSEHEKMSFVDDIEVFRMLRKLVKLGLIILLTSVILIPIIAIVIAMIKEI